MQSNIKHIILMLLKAILINWQSLEESNSKLKEIREFSLEKLGKFAKKEIQILLRNKCLRGKI